MGHQVANFRVGVVFLCAISVYLHKRFKRFVPRVDLWFALGAFAVVEESPDKHKGDHCDDCC